MSRKTADFLLSFITGPSFPAGVLAIIAIYFVSALAHAQQSPASPREQALTQKLIGEINNNIQCNTDIATLQQQIAKLQEELKAKEKEPVKNNKKP